MKKGLKTEAFKDLHRAHHLRILGKKIRYVQSEINTAPTKIVHLKKFHTLFGKLNDAGRNIEIVKKLLAAHNTPAIQKDGQSFIESQLHELNILTSKIRKNCKLIE